MSQPRLFEFRMGERSPDTLVVADANRAAVALLRDWRSWPAGALALVGPAGAGKTHLSLAWAVEAGARALPEGVGEAEAAALFSQSGGRLVFDDARPGAPAEAVLWRLLDLARSQGGAVLLVSSAAPAAWPTASPDLRSRLAALPVARLGEPDEALMEVVLRRICREQFILLSDAAARYVARRLPRSFAAARAWAGALEAELSQPAQPVGLKAAKRALERALAGTGRIAD